MKSKLLIVILSLNLLFLVAHSYSTQTSLYGHRNFTEYLSGSEESNIIIAAPHGGYDIPSDIPDRFFGCWDAYSNRCIWEHGCNSVTTPKSFKCQPTIGSDENTEDLALTLRWIIGAKTGIFPHLILCKLNRRKVDANRSPGEGTYGNAEARRAFDDYHYFIKLAKSRIAGQGLLLDIHGHSHPEQWVEFGYLISGWDLDTGNYRASDTSINTLAHMSGIDIRDLVAGNASLGGLMEKKGYKTVPSPGNVGPNEGNYFTGGYILARHGSKYNGQIDAVQIETPRHLRHDARRYKYASDLAGVIVDFVQRMYPDAKFPKKANHGNLKARKENYFHRKRFQKGHNGNTSYKKMNAQTDLLRDIESDLMIESENKKLANVAEQMKILRNILKRFNQFFEFFKSKYV